MQTLHIARAHDRRNVGRDMGEAFEHGGAERVFQAHTPVQMQRTRGDRQSRAGDLI